ncbi:MAG: L-rhamnose/proton symporter RhaT [Tidjanibacter sp.]|nr:L-rhamnose/proton symporter RhaT [Tidjanibacter sp.]MBR6831468.1 L-rhamnose/proton symporter RhaT [Tidjanibacter sp.]
MTGAIILGLLIITIGSFGQSSSYVPINKIKTWSWECFWLVQGIFAYLLFPLCGALLGTPEGVGLFEFYSTNKAAIVPSIVYGILWGVGGLTFGLSMRYLGVALGQSIALGLCSGLGTLIPALMKGDDLFHGEGLILLIGVCITLAGICVIGYAGSLRAKNMTEEEKRAAIKDFALTKGLLIAVLCGVMSACFSLGLEAGAGLKQAALDAGVKTLFAELPVTLLVTFGGFITNAAYCIWQNVKNKTGKEYLSVPSNVLLSNILFCALAGILWYSQFFGLAIGKSFLENASPVLFAFSWCILMSLNVLFSNLWGIILKEWKGSGKKTIVVLVSGLVILLISIFFPTVMG